MNLFELSVTGAVLIFAVILFRAVGKKRLPMRTFTVLWHVALLRLFLPVELPSPISAASIGQRLIRSLTGTFSRADSAGAADVPASPAFSGISGGTAFYESGFTEARPISEAFHTADRIAEESVRSTRFAPDWRLIVWIAGAVLILSVFAVLYVRALQRFRQSLPLESDFARDWLAAHSPRRKIEVRRSDRIGSPLTYGVLHPVILLPSDTDLTDTKRLEFILAHELTHIRHFDSLTKLLLALAVSLHWFNPAVWVLYRFFNRDMELACDEAVVRMFGADTRRDYALMLLELVEKKNSPPLPANGFGQVAIRERIGAIMKVRRITWAASLAAVIAVCSITAVFATTAAQEKPEEPEVPEQTEQTDAGADALAAEEEEQERILEEELQAEFQTQLQAQVQAELDAQLELTPEQVPEPEIPLWEIYNLTEEEFMSEKNLRFREKLEEKEARRLAEEAARLQAELDAQLNHTPEQVPEPELPLWERYNLTEEEYMSEKNLKFREKLEEKEARRLAEAELERLTAEWQARLEAEQEAQEEVPEWERLGISEEEYMQGEKYQKYREKMEQKQAERIVREARARAEAELREKNARDGE
ncbi:MAG: hypothetical protein E7576_03680 [Ruminococcaceae bacterium]|nr:hypothetical protein [Oscillospiraceae bacterium]